MAYLDTREYYKRRKKQVEWLLLQRAYFMGHPYGPGPIDSFDYSRLWEGLLSPTDDDPPVYLDNIAKLIIETNVADVLPQGTRLSLSTTPEEETLTQLYSLLMNFGPGYPSGIEGFFEWVESILLDIAQTGDGLILVRYLPRNGKQAGRIRFNYYPAECWDAEIDPDSDEVKFYRIEYKYKDSDGELYWRRFDVHRDHITRYRDSKALWQPDNGMPPPAIEPVALDGIGGFMPPPMDTLRRGVIQETAENSLLAELGEWVAIPLIWRRTSQESHRGDPELMTNELAAIDDVNRLLTRWKEAAINVGDPSLMALDLALPREPGDEGAELSRADLGPGAVLSCVSLDERSGKLTYPENLPTTFPHSEVLERIRSATFGNTPNIGLDPGKISRFGELSGFASMLLKYNHTQKVGQRRRRVLNNGILRALETGMQLLQLRGLLPEGISSNTSMKLEYGGPLMSPDEKLKQVTMISMLLKMGVPASEVVPLMPFDPKDIPSLISNIESYQHVI